MIQIPFNKANFACDMKPKISGANSNLQYENLESSLTSNEVRDLLSEYFFICSCLTEFFILTDKTIEDHAMQLLSK
jgi:hypothetical protein